MSRVVIISIAFFVSIFMLLFVFIEGDGVTSSVVFEPNYSLETAKLFGSTKQIDYLEAKITIDKLIDPSADSQFVRDEVDRLEAGVRRILKPGASDADKVMVLRGYLYLGGEWNDNRPFKYDLNDPKGKSETSRLLHYYLEARLGNCVSMPILHAILGQRLGLDMTIASAPNHVLVIYTDENGKQTNIEATSGGHPSRLAWYKQNLPLSDLSIQTGAYMRKLNGREVVVVMSHDLIAHLLREKKYDDVSAILPMLAKHNPRDAHISFQHTLLYAMKLEDEFYSKYATEKDMPAELMSKFQEYRHQEELGLRAAANLGYFGEE